MYHIQKKMCVYMCINIYIYIYIYIYECMYACMYVYKNFSSYSHNANDKRYLVQDHAVTYLEG